MKRLHLHISVKNLEETKAFYTALFNTPPSVDKEDYAKWMLDDPYINLAISKKCCSQSGIDHVGLQVDDAAELDVLGARLKENNIEHISQKGANCCYAKSDKHWTKDPQNVVWELYHTMESAELYGSDNRIQI